MGYFQNNEMVMKRYCYERLFIFLTPSNKHKHVYNVHAIVQAKCLPRLINKFISSVLVGFVFSHAMYLRHNSFCFTSIEVNCGGTEGLPLTIPRVTSS